MLESARHQATLLPEKLLAFLNTGIKLRDFAIAAIVLVVLALIVYVCVFFYRKKYPRPIFLFSSVSLNKQMGHVYEDMNLLYHRIDLMSSGLAAAANDARNAFMRAAHLAEEPSGNLAPPVSIPLTIQFIKDNIELQDPSKRASIQTKPAPLAACEDNAIPSKCIGPDGGVDKTKLDDPDCKLANTQPKGVAHGATGETKFEIYLSHDNLLKSGADKFIYRRIMKHFRKYSACGTDNNAGFAAVEAVVKEVEAVQQELEQAMGALDAFETEFPPGQAAKWVDYCVSVRKLHFYFHHGTNELKGMYDIRRFSLLNFLVVLMRPYVDKILIKEIYMRWVDVFSWSSINEAREAFDKFWYWIGNGGGGTWPGLLPSKMLEGIREFMETLINS